MKPNYKEDPKEWRKSALQAVLAFTILASFLCWRRHLQTNSLATLVGMAVLAVTVAALKPRLFRGWYRVSLWLGFHSSQFAGRCALFLFFVFIITPLGWVLRLSGQDSLQLKRPPGAKTFWHKSKDSSPMNRPF